MEKQQNSVAIEYINIPVLILNGEIENVRSNIVYTVDDNGIKKLVTSEDDAKNLLYNYFNSSKEEQEIFNRIEEEDVDNAHIVIEFPCEEKNYIKNLNYNISLEFIGYNSENKNPQFKIIHDTISGNPKLTIQSLNQAVVIKEQFQLF
jgi:hypothetical protein